MKKVLILGATGTAGSAITKKLMENENYQLTLVSRKIKRTKLSSKVSTICGDASKLEELRQMIQNQDVIYCAISGKNLPIIAQNLVTAMVQEKIKRLIFMGAIGIYNEIPEEIDGKDNVNRNPEQIPNKESVTIIEKSNLNYTIVRPGFLREGEKNDFVLSEKGEAVKGHITTISSLVELAIKLIEDDHLYVKKSIAITKDESNSNYGD